MSRSQPAATMRDMADEIERLRAREDDAEFLISLLPDIPHIQKDVERWRRGESVLSTDQ